MDDHTVFRVPVDDETMAAVLEQAEAVRVPPRDLIAAVVRDVFLAMKADGAVVEAVRVQPAPPPPSKSKH